jgi:predicted chitinase
VAINIEQLGAIMPRCSPQHRELYLPHLTSAMSEFEISHTNLRAAAFLAQLAHESGELRWMEEIASGAAYENRKDLGNVYRGDGKRFKGRGPIQLTGRANYKRYGDLLGVDLIDQPHLAATPAVGFRIAGLFWKLHGLNERADRDEFEAITRAINGGLNGLSDRLRYYQRAKQVLGC